MSEITDKEFEQLLITWVLLDSEKEEFKEILATFQALKEIIDQLAIARSKVHVNMMNWWDAVCTRLAIPLDLRNRLEADYRTGKVKVKNQC